MEFNNEQSIYLQISDKIEDRILSRKWTAGMRIPSIREIAMQMEVNPNTVVRSYNHLQEKGMLENKRGIGYFISENAYMNIRGEMREKFMNSELPALIRKMLLLDIGLDEIKSAWENEREELNHA